MGDPCLGRRLGVVIAMVATRSSTPGESSAHGCGPTKSTPHALVGQTGLAAASRTNASTVRVRLEIACIGAARAVA